MRIPYILCFVILFQKVSDVHTSNLQAATEKPVSTVAAVTSEKTYISEEGKGVVDCLISEVNNVFLVIINTFLFLSNSYFILKDFPLI